MVRFLAKEEYPRTRALSLACFQDNAFDESFYVTTGAVYQNRIAVLEQDGEILSMVQIAPRAAVIHGLKQPAPYLMMVATRPEQRHRGYMDEVMQFVCTSLKEEGTPWTFLVAVDRNIYRHLGFSYDWPFAPNEADLLFADDGLTLCSAKLLCAERFEVPEAIVLS